MPMLGSGNDCNSEYPYSMLGFFFAGVAYMLIFNLSKHPLTNLARKVKR